MKSKKRSPKSGQSEAEAIGGETNRYKVSIERIFFDRWKEGIGKFEFVRDEIKHKANELAIELPDNIGDIPYSFRYRAALPLRIVKTQPKGSEWIIEVTIPVPFARHRPLQPPHRYLPWPDYLQSSKPPTDGCRWDRPD